MKLRERDFGDGPTFGQYLRAARLGWRWSRQHGGFVRITLRTNVASIELYPAGLVPSRSTGASHVCWWEENNFLNYIEELQNVRRVKRPIYFEVPLNREVCV